MYSTPRCKTEHRVLAPRGKESGSSLYWCEWEQCLENAESLNCLNIRLSTIKLKIKAPVGIHPVYSETGTTDYKSFRRA